MNFTVTSGEVISLLGPNGVGKTTLLRTIMGFLKPLNGIVSLDDRNILSLPRKYIASRIGYVPQINQHSFSLSVEDVIILGRLSHLGIFAHPGYKDMQIAEETLKVLNIESLRHKIFNNLSGGEQQIVMIARALVQKPMFLIMDEPTSNLDFGNQIRILKIIKHLAKCGISVLFTTHLPDQAFLCEVKVILFYKNAEPEIGKAADVLTEHNLQRAYGAAIKVITQKNDDGSILKTCVPMMGE
ncbi:ABC transporter ATP-binding protein [Pectinatus cerevisiiphilus]|uniref:Iron complex transport system ATP-binding protein n=1 Tax=Pectinatus cerevisiiphilus TaxID=86956 RepID=A0A4R3K5B5_9FIRM|nr:ABC transporter ATP-binding protein [Pectinatus cerevisiiphilus]TCS77973.1 iron complex transport system ATP-binding protein [Pectinatus cerevisiiphilus]